jgi:hypothetical protein
MKNLFNEGNQIDNFILCVCENFYYSSGTVINYGSDYGSNFLTRYGSYGSGSGSTTLIKRQCNHRLFSTYNRRLMYLEQRASHSSIE